MRDAGWSIDVSESGELYAWAGDNFDVYRGRREADGKKVFTGYDVTLYDGEGKMLANIGGVTFKDDNTHEPYRRVLAAELASEATHNA